MGLGPVQATILGAITGGGVGIVRDVLLRKVPTVLRSELYAVPALAGASVVATAHCGRQRQRGLRAGRRRTVPAGSSHRRSLPDQHPQPPPANAAPRALTCDGVQVSVVGWTRCHSTGRRRRRALAEELDPR
ncbi:MAG: hypothetical protein GEU74_12930 [Nitriliruptorales bacterium]|nr:hypothetical protein [Nitriliruptorales bacterium]